MPLAFAFLTTSRKLRRELEIVRHLAAKFRHQLLVVIKLHGPGFERQSVGFALVAPRLLCPRLDISPVEVGEIEQEVVFVILGLIRFSVEDIRRLAGAKRSLKRGVEGVLFVPGRLDLDARILAFELGDGLFDILALDLLGRPVRPERQLLWSAVRAALVGTPSAMMHAAASAAKILNIGFLPSETPRVHLDALLPGTQAADIRRLGCHAIGRQQNYQ